MGEAIGQEMTVYERNKNLIKILKEITNNLGRIEITKNFIICHVNDIKLFRYLKDNNNILHLNGFNEEDKLHLQSLYGIGKPIKYIINEYDFSNVTLSTTGDTIIKFNICDFIDNLYFNNVDQVEFSDSMFHLDNDLNLFNDGNKQIKDIKLINCSFEEHYGSPTVDKINIISTNLYINHCKISGEHYISIDSCNAKIANARFNTYRGNIDIISKKLYIKNCKANASYLSLNSDNIKLNNLSGSAAVIINNSNWNIGKIHTGSNFMYNGIKLQSFKDYFINPESFELLRQRAILANTLYQIYNKCESDIEEKTNSYTRKLVNKTISETLGE